MLSALCTVARMHQFLPTLMTACSACVIRRTTLAMATGIAIKSTIPTQIRSDVSRSRAIQTALLALVLTGCGASDRIAPQTQSVADSVAESGSVVLQPSEAFPSDDLSQWVSYPAQVSVVNIMEERELPPEAELADTGAGYLGRVVRVNVERTLWTNPDEAPLPAAFDMRVYGWIVAQDGSRREARATESPRISPGERYVIPLTRFFGDIGPLSSHSIALLDATNRIVVAPGQRDPVIEQYVGRTVEEVASDVSRARPDPVAKRYKSLPPYERVQAVLKERAAGRAGSD